MTTVTGLPRTILLTMAAAQTTGIHLGPVALAEITGASHADVLRALADLTDTGAIQPEAVDHDEDQEDEPGHVDAKEAARLPRTHRVVLLALMSTAEATAAELAADVGDEEDAAEAVAALSAAGLVVTVGATGAVCHTETGWDQAQAEVAAGPVTGDPAPLRLLYGMWAVLARQAAADGRNLTEVATDVMAYDS